MALALMFALRYIKGSSQEKSIATMVKVCFLGLVIATGTLALVVAIMSGIEKATYEKIQGIHPQITIQSSADSEFDIEQLRAVFKKDFPEIIAFSPSNVQHIMIYNKALESMPTIVVLKTIDPELEAHTTTLEQKIIDSGADEKKMSTIIHDNHILIGESLAQELMIHVGDSIDILYVPADQQYSNRKIMLTAAQAVIGGIFKTGIEEFDHTIIYGNAAFEHTMFPDAGMSAIGIKISSQADEQSVISRLKKQLNLDVYGWKDLYPALVSALRLEKYATIIILSLIILVASMNIISLLFMHIIQKRGDIAILKAMGTSDRTIQLIFLSMGMIIALAGIFVGICCAIIIGLLLKTYLCIELPDIYYVTHLPVELNPWLFFVVASLALLLSLLATIIPLKRVKHINISDVLRFEA